MSERCAPKKNLCQFHDTKTVTVWRICTYTCNMSFFGRASKRERERENPANRALLFLFFGEPTARGARTRPADTCFGYTSFPHVHTRLFFPFPGYLRLLLPLLLALFKQSKGEGCRWTWTCITRHLARACLRPRVMHVIRRRASGFNARIVRRYGSWTSSLYACRFLVSCNLRGEMRVRWLNPSIYIYVGINVDIDLCTWCVKTAPCNRDVCDMCRVWQEIVRGQ